MRLPNPLNLFRRSKPIVITPVPVKLPKLPVQEPPRKSQGHVVKAKRGLAYKLPTGRLSGGRVVRTIPRDLRKMKEAAENADV